MQETEEERAYTQVREVPARDHRGVTETQKEAKRIGNLAAATSDICKRRSVKFSNAKETDEVHRPDVREKAGRRD